MTLIQATVEVDRVEDPERSLIDPMRYKRGATMTISFTLADGSMAVEHEARIPVGGLIARARPSTDLEERLAAEMEEVFQRDRKRRELAERGADWTQVDADPSSLKPTNLAERMYWDDREREFRRVLDWLAAHGEITQAFAGEVTRNLAEEYALMKTNEAHP